MSAVRAVVWTGDDLVVTDALEVREPGPGEVSVGMVASGICHSDLNVMDGTSPIPAPVVLGHEGAGIVEQLGPGVTEPAVGARVVINAMTPCRRCSACDRGRLSECREAFGRGGEPFRLDGRPVRSYASVSSFAERVTVRADQLVEVPDDIPLEVAAVVGCAVTTAFGSVRNVAHVDAGETVAVFGIGGIGVNVLQTCRLQHASRIVAVDVDPDKAAIARRFGATDVLTIDADTDVATALRELVPSGVDHVFECSGAIAAIEAGIASLAVGGTCVLIGIPRRGTRATFDVGHLFNGRRILGAYNGAIRAHHDIPLIFELARQGALDLEGVVTNTHPVAKVHEALRDLHRGGAVRTVLTY
jgi:S-(hydroxymethyl)glutathione dehydrogenase/alcohol dehydrogenase